MFVPAVRSFPRSRASQVFCCSALFMLAACEGMLGAPTAPRATLGTRAGETPERVPNDASPSETGEPNPAVIAVSERPPDRELFRSCSADTARGAARPALRRLTKSELLASLQSVFGSALQPLSNELAQFPETHEPNPSQIFSAVHLRGEISAWIDTATNVARHVAHTAAFHSYAPDGCTKNEPVSAPCWRSFVDNLADRLLRRDIPEGELDLLADSSGASTAEKVETLIARLLLSPDFLFHVELGKPGESAAGPRVRLTDREVANRIAFATTGAPPDSLLLAAVTSGALGSVSEAEAQVARLYATDAGKLRVRSFISEWLRLDRIVDPPKQVAQLVAPLSPDWPSGTLANAYREEAWRFVLQNVFTEAGDFTNLMTSTRTIPVRTAAVYGLDPSTNTTVQSTEDHPGLFTRAGLLASGTTETSPIMRGVTLRRQILCDVLSPPNFDVVAQRLIDLGGHSPISAPNHEIVSLTTGDPQCMSCHAAINPLGFLLERYDFLGKVQTKQDVYGPPEPQAPNVLLASHPLPGPQQNVIIEPGLPTSFEGPADLAVALGKSEHARACLAVRLFRDQTHEQEQPADACALADATRMLVEGASVFDVLVRSVANEDLLWRRAP